MLKEIQMARNLDRFAVNAEWRSGPWPCPQLDSQGGPLGSCPAPTPHWHEDRGPCVKLLGGGGTGEGEAADISL